jgi:hypothetical protein
MAITIKEDVTPEGKVVSVIFPRDVPITAVTYDEALAAFEKATQIVAPIYKVVFPRPEAPSSTLVASVKSFATNISRRSAQLVFCAPFSSILMTIEIFLKRAKIKFIFEEIAL